jgi:SPP1 family predicted phage head-tail adaptor
MNEFAGALRERISFEQRSEERDLLAGARSKWRYDGAVWAAVTPLGTGDAVIADSVSALPRWRVIIRRRDGIDLSSRIIWRGRYLNVRSVDQDPRQPEQMTLITEEQR